MSKQHPSLSVCLHLGAILVGVAAGTAPAGCQESCMTVDEMQIFPIAQLQTLINQVSRQNSSAAWGRRTLCTRGRPKPG